MRKTVIYLLVLYGALTAFFELGYFLGVPIPSEATTLMTLLAFSFAILHGSQRLGWRNTLLFLLITFGVSLLFESLGVATGLVYGPYHYTDKLGPKFLGLVPYLIPLAWFMMMYPSYIMADRLTPVGKGAWRWRITLAALGALIMTAWDLAMDPLMVGAAHWTWEVQGAYFSVPLQNYWGWWLTSFVTLALFLWLGKIKPPDANTRMSSDVRPFDRLAIYSYAITGASSILFDLQVGLAGPSLAGLFAMLPWVLMSLIL